MVENWNGLELGVWDGGFFGTFQPDLSSVNWRDVCLESDWPCWIFWMGTSFLENVPQSRQLVYSRFAEAGIHAVFELSCQLARCGHGIVFWCYAWVGDVLVLVENGCRDYCPSCVLPPHYP